MNPSCPDYRGLANMICEEIMAKDAALSEAQARVEELEWLVDVYDCYRWMTDYTDEQWCTRIDGYALDELRESYYAARASAGV